MTRTSLLTNISRLEKLLNRALEILGSHRENPELVLFEERFYRLGRTLVLIKEEIERSRI